MEVNLQLNLGPDARGIVKKKAGNVEVVLRGAYFHCTKCNTIKPADQFGLRKMGDGTVRNQAQCSACRKRK